MVTHKFDLSEPEDFNRLRDLLATALSDVEWTRLASARAKSKTGNGGSKIPKLLLPPECGDPNTWT